MFGLMIFSLVATMASAAASAYSQKQQGEQAKANAEYNAQLAEMDAQEEASQRAIEATSERDESRRRLESMTARYAKSGILMAGTPSAMVAKQAETDEFNILTRDRGSTIRAGNYNTNAELLRIRGADAASAGRWEAGGTILGGIGSSAGTYSRYNTSMGSRNTGSNNTNGILA